jgi:hypothetical protein
MINGTNWNYSFYQSEDHKAFVSFAAEPGIQEDLLTYYYVTLANMEGIDLFQKRFSDLTSAIDHANQTYAHLDFKDLSVTSQDASGCSTCQAH